MLRFEDFTESAQAAAKHAEEVMEHYGHSHVDTEHFLLALMEQPGAIDPRILKSLKVDPQVVVQGLDRYLQVLTKPIFHKRVTEKVTITTRLHRVLERAIETALQWREDKVSGEYIILAILEGHKTPGAQELENAGLTRTRFYAALLKVRDQDARAAGK
jgi:ATP-dependent Clp protease ATP-binding subunit ClpA